MSAQLKSVYFVGPMGAGKTTIGKLLAKRLGRQFYDSDAHIEEMTGADIPWIFDKEGEAGFRIRETRAIDELTQMSDVVIATGGGAVIKAENRKMLKRGLVVFLNASVDVQLERTRKSDNRPLLNTPSPRQVLHRLSEQRLPFYREVADIEVITGHNYPKQMVDDILEKIEELGYIFET